MKNKATDEYFNNVGKVTIAISLLSGASMVIIIVVLLSLINAIVYDSSGNGLISLIFTLIWLIVIAIRRFGAKKLAEQFNLGNEVDE